MRLANNGRGGFEGYKKADFSFRSCARWSENWVKEERQRNLHNSIYNYAQRVKISSLDTIDECSFTPQKQQKFAWRKARSRG